MTTLLKNAEIALNDSRKFCEFGSRFDASIATAANRLFMAIENAKGNNYAKLPAGYQRDQIIWQLATSQAKLEIAILESRQYNMQAADLESAARTIIMNAI